MSGTGIERLYLLNVVSLTTSTQALSSSSSDGGHHVVGAGVGVLDGDLLREDVSFAVDVVTSKAHNRPIMLRLELSDRITLLLSDHDQAADAGYGPYAYGPYGP